MHEDEVFLREAEALHSLRAMEEIEKNPKISQRELSNHLGVALGITNALLKTLVRKGLVKIRGENNRTLTYHLTHAGVLAKSRLAMQWTLNTIDFYRQARLGVANKLAVLAEQGARSVVLYGGGELAEIAAVVAPETGLKVVGIVNNQPTNNFGGMLGYPLLQFDELTSIAIDTIVICVEADDMIIQELNRHIKEDVQLYRLI